ncbi:hypothetical protein BAU08_20625 [Bordetella bronchialis]|uniref:Uncharacterized protein n=1 Tax=Bordetella bronchialis TaxID=463025 RepID=A0A193G1V6_9BORD|nr:hypothetical protein BAU08_20625 [Bordetella bronchialis]
MRGHLDRDIAREVRGHPFRQRFRATAQSFARARVHADEVDGQAPFPLADGQMRGGQQIVIQGNTNPTLAIMQAIQVDLGHDAAQCSKVRDSRGNRARRVAFSMIRTGLPIADRRDVVPRVVRGRLRSSIPVCRFPFRNRGAVLVFRARQQGPEQVRVVGIRPHARPQEPRAIPERHPQAAMHILADIRDAGLRRPVGRGQPA